MNKAKQFYFEADDDRLFNIHKIGDESKETIATVLMSEDVYMIVDALNREEHEVKAPDYYAAMAMQAIISSAKVLSPRKTAKIAKEYGFALHEELKDSR